MKNEITTTNQTQLAQFNSEKIDLIKRTVAKDATDLELQLFIEQCKRTGLDPITRQIYFIKDHTGKVQVQTSIDGFRLVAERSGEYEGQTQPQWCGDDGKWTDVWLSKTPPKACKIGVWKRNFREPLVAIALFDEYAQRKKDGSLGFMWGKMPALMIAKVAESLALRKAFPNDLSGLYTSDEMAQASIEATHEEPKWQRPATKNEPTRTPSTPARDFGYGEPVGSSFDSHDSQTGNSGFNDSFPTSFENIPTSTGFDDQYRIPFGKYKDKALTEVPTNDLINYSKWLQDESAKKGTPLKPAGLEFLAKLEEHLRFNHDSQ
jgi:phage recombination protein Bet